MPPTMIVTVGALLSTVPALVGAPEALLAQAAMVVAARKAAPAAPMRLVFMELSFESGAAGVRGCCCRAAASRGAAATRRRHLRGTAGAASAAGAARAG